MNKLVIASEEAEEYAELVNSSKLNNLEIIASMDSDTDRSISTIANCNIILGDPPLVARLLSRVKKLSWVQSTWAGVDSLCQPQLRQDYVLTGAKDIFGPAISEYVMTYLFALERRVFDIRANQAKKHWHPLAYRLAREVAIGIIGLGSIGTCLARTARGFGLRVTAYNRTGKPCAEVEKVYTSPQLGEFLADLDYVVITLPGTAQTRHFIHADVFKMMKPSAVIINVGRGQVVNETDLIEALQAGVIGGAVLDVFEEEPLPESSPLWAMPNTWITPHNAAVSFPRDIVAIFAENYHRFVQHKSLMHVVDFNLGY